MQIQLSDHFNYKKLLRFTFSSIIMMIFTSVYSVVDGLFVSNFVGKTPFAAVNFIMPLLMMLGALGFMFGTGGSALVAKAFGEGDPDRANRLFSLFIYTTVALGCVIAALGFLMMPVIAAALGAEGQMLADCVLYGRVVILGLPFFMLQMELQSFFVTAEKPQLGLYVTLAAGIVNILLDALFVAVLEWKLVGAAAATAISQASGALCGIFYFGRKNSSILRLRKCRYDGKALLQATINGSSELMSNVSMSLVSMLYNVQLMRFAGEDGVSAYGVLMYVNLIFLSVFIGYSVGTAPVISFHYGAQNQAELKSLLRKSLMIILLSSAAMLGLGLLLARPLSSIFVGYAPDLFAMTLRGFHIYSFSFLFAGVAIFGSSFFTALSDGLTSALVSFLRTLVFQVAAVLLLPLVWELDGIWLSIVVAELMAFLATFFFLLRKRKRYGY